MELLLMIDAAKRASAYKVIAVIPYFGWARQDRKDKPRVSIGAKLVANMIQGAGADRVITVDLHADQIQGFFDIPVDHIYGSNVLAPYVASLNLKKLIVASPDVGGSKRAAAFAKKMHGMTERDVPMVICYKNREVFNQVSEIRVLGDVYGKDVIIVDDMADTAGTLCKAAEVMKKAGAKSVRAVVSMVLCRDRLVSVSRIVSWKNWYSPILCPLIPPVVAKCTLRVWLNRLLLLSRQSRPTPASAN